MKVRGALQVLEWSVEAKVGLYGEMGTHLGGRLQTGEIRVSLARSINPPQDDITEVKGLHFHQKKSVVYGIEGFWEPHPSCLSPLPRKPSRKTWPAVLATVLMRWTCPRITKKTGGPFSRSFQSVYIHLWWGTRSWNLPRGQPFYVLDRLVGATAL